MRSLRFLGAVLLALSALSATATVLVPLDDRDLMAAADRTVTGIVERSRTVRTDDGAVETWTTVRAVDVLKGRGATHLVLRQPGGVVDDLAVVVLDTLPLRAGDAVLLFGREARGGGMRPVGRALGILRLGLDATGAPVATDALGRRRPLAAFLDALTTPAERTRLMTTAPATWVSAPFTFLGVPPGPPGRWFEFDRGGTSEIRSANGDADLGRARSDALLREAFTTWDSVPGATARLTLGPDVATGLSVASGICDGRSVAQFNDPQDELDDLTGCAGVLAVGGYCARSTAVGPAGETYRVITEGDLTMNRRIASCFSELDVAEVVTHEAGHVLGLGHSSENPSEPDATLRAATMFFLAHFDGRGSAVRDDDMAGLRVLYPADDDGDGIPNELDVCADTPAGHPTDETGCACVDPQHVVCPPGDVCTISRCEFETGQCLSAPVDCTGGEPCLVGTCTLAEGCLAQPAEGYDAISCALDRDFAPSECSDDRIPRTVARLVRRARSLVAKGRTATPARQDVRLARAAAKLGRATKRLVRSADPARRRPLSSACATTLGVLVEDARVRVESRGTSVLFDPTPRS